MVAVSGVSGALAIHEVNKIRFPQRVAEEAWAAACRFWSIYGYAKPRINRSILEGEKESGDQIAFIDFAEKRVSANLHRLEQANLLDLLEEIFVHELGHKFCPEDLKTLLLINSAVCDVIEDENAAGTVGNLFRDMIVNINAFHRGKRSISKLYTRLWKDNPDAVQQVIGRAYEKVFQRYDTSRAYAQSVIRVKPSAKLEAAADKIAAIIMNARRSNWLKGAREFAEILKELMPAMKAGAVYVITDMGPGSFSPAGRALIPPKGKGDIKELQKRLGGVVFDLRQKEGGDDKQPCSLPTFKRFLEGSKIEVDEREALVWYYRELIGGKVVKVPEVSVSSGALYPFAPKTWRPGDPPHQLDIVLSRSISGVLIPGVTTKKWEWKRGQHITVGKDYPDLDLWVDSSGSTVDPTKGISRIVTSGMIVAKSFLATRKAVRVVNWSGTRKGNPLYISTDGFIRDEDEIDRKIARYFGRNTILPIDEFEKPYQGKGKEKYIVMITDLGIQNFTEETINRLQKIFDQSVGGTVFLVGKGEGVEQTRAVLEEIGFEVQPVEDESTLDQYALRLTRKLFEQRLEAGADRIVL